MCCTGNHLKEAAFILQCFCSFLAVTEINIGRQLFRNRAGQYLYESQATSMVYVANVIARPLDLHYNHYASPSGPWSASENAQNS